jgi:signal transduction histidine kinase
VFASVAREVSHVLGLPLTTVARIESGNVAIIVGAAGNHPHAAGARYVIEGPSASALVLETGQPARLDGAREIEGSVGGVRSVMTVAGTAAAPISVNGQTWGIVASGVPRGLELPIGVEQRLTQFTGLVATAISQATARSELLESRRRLVQAGDEERRRIVRDLHDGAQQRLVHTVMTLQRAQRTASPDEASALLAEALNHASAAIDELRDLAQGLHPAVLTHRGLAAALETLAERSPVPVALDVGDERYPSSVEAAAYFVAAEGLTNVAKYAKATSARVCAQVCDRDLVLTVADDGVGNATVADGHGLGGLRDRMTAIGGRLTIHSPAGEGTTIRADIPIP